MALFFETILMLSQRNLIPEGWSELRKPDNHAPSWTNTDRVTGFLTCSCLSNRGTRRPVLSGIGKSLTAVVGRFPESGGIGKPVERAWFARRGRIDHAV